MSRKSLNTSGGSFRDSSYSANNSIPTTVDDFLEKNSELKVLKSKDNFPLDSIDSDGEEVYIIQCPKALKIEELVHEKLNFKRDRNILCDNRIEASIETFKSGKCVTLCNVNSSGGMQSLNAAGRIMFHASLPIVEDRDFMATYIKSEEEKPVEFPKNLKTRHPLLGCDFKDRLVLPATVERQLKDAGLNRVIIKTESISGRKSKKQKRRSHVQEEEETAPMEEEIIEDDDVQEKSMRKRLKKEKRAKEAREEEQATDLHKKVKKEKSLEDTEVSSPKKKKNKRGSVSRIKVEDGENDISNDLEWLTQI